MQRHRQLLVAAAATVVLALGSGVLPAAAATTGAAGAPASSSGLVPVAPAGAAGEPARKPGSLGAARLASPACAAPAAGRYACATVTEPRSAVTRRGGGASTQAIQVIPTWCNNGGIWGTRTQACEVFTITYTTYVVTNGVTTVTGQLSLNAWPYSYSSPGLPNWAHQFSVASYAGWGDALRASVTGSARASGSCTRSSSSFPAQPVTPFLTLRSGEAFFNTTATALGAVGFCTTTWDIVFTNPGYNPSNPVSRSLRETRCDNATPAQGARPRRVGCVVYWYASAALYSRSLYPSLTRHVSLAQGSGLPGNSFAAPLTRTTNQTTINTNRTLACGNAPSIPGKSCDEYPLATSNQGLAAGGTLRTFDGCNINAPRATGPTGASACMITASENNAQGGIMSAFNYDWRVLNGDPFRVLISA
jgi:hypothetical protein